MRVEVSQSYILDYVAMVTDEEESPSFGHVDLHPDQTVCVAWEMVQCDALAEVHGLVIEGLPVSAAVVSKTEMHRFRSANTYRESFR